MHPGNNFIIAVFAHRWGTIIIMTMVMALMTQVSFNIWVSLIAFAGTIIQQFIVLTDDTGAKRRYTNSLMILTVLFYVIFIPYSLSGYKGFVDKYEDVNTTGYSHFYKSVGDNSNELFFVKSNSKTVDLTIDLSDTRIKKYLGASNPILVMHTTNDRWYQYDDVTYDVRFEEVSK